MWAQNSGNGATTFTENYSYHPAGAVTAKMLAVSRQYSSGSPVTGSMLVSYAYDTAGRVASVTYPMAQPFQPQWGIPNPVTLQYAYDSMGRPASLTDPSGVTIGYYSNNWPGGPLNWVQNVTYDLSNRMTSMQAISSYMSSYYNWKPSYALQAMSYNANGQMTSVSWSSSTWYYPTWTTPVGIAYSYAAQTNGQITQAVDTLSGETIAYQYDALKRLTSASSTPNAGSSVSAWAQTYQYDGFGNLTAKVLNGATTSIPVNAADEPFIECEL